MCCMGCPPPPSLPSMPAPGCLTVPASRVVLQLCLLPGLLVPVCCATGAVGARPRRCFRGCVLPAFGHLDVAAPVCNCRYAHGRYAPGPTRHLPHPQACHMHAPMPLPPPPPQPPRFCLAGNGDGFLDILAATPTGVVLCRNTRTSQVGSSANTRDTFLSLL
jgi:hypothetical protein